MSNEQSQIPLGEEEQESSDTESANSAVQAANSDGTEPEVAPTSLPPALTAGDLIRQAREAQGLHPETLASALKVPTRKIEALESGELDEMPDPAFTRALAAAVCRHLKLEPAAVLALLPQAGPMLLQTPHMRDSLRNEDGQMGRVRTASSIDAGTNFFKRPLWFAAVALLLLAASVPFWPRLQSGLTLTAAQTTNKNQTPITHVTELEPTMKNAAQPAAVAASASAPAPAPAVVIPAAAASAAKGALPAASSSAPLLLRASGESWLQVTDASGRVLLSRTLTAGESVPLTGKAPFRLIVGRAELVSIAYQGVNQPYPTAMQAGLARLSVPAPAL